MILPPGKYHVVHKVNETFKTDKYFAFCTFCILEGVEEGEGDGDENRHVERIRQGHYPVSFLAWCGMVDFST